MPSRERSAKRLESGELFRAVVDRQRLACLMVDAGARLFDSSAAGAVLLEPEKWLKVDPGGILAGSSPADTARLHALVRRTAGGRGGGSMRIGNQLGAEDVIQAIPATARAGSPVNQPRGASVLLFVAALERAGQEAAGWIDVTKIQTLLKCTQAEAEVAASLLQGLTPGRIAQDRRVSLSTVRTQIRALLDSSSKGRVAELIVLLARAL